MWGLLFCERVGASFVLNEDGRRRAVRSAFLSAVTLCLSVAHADAQSLTEDEIRIQQEALIWTTEYEGLIDGKLGPGTRTAINKFQARIRDAVTGVLTPGEVQQLVREGNANKNSFEFRQVIDSNVGVSVGIPHKLLTGPVSTKWGKHWDSSRLSIDTLRFGADVTLKDLHDKLISINNRQISYDRLVDDDWFVISAFEGDAAVYVRANVVRPQNGHSEIRGFSVWMSKDRPSSYQSIPPAMLSSFRSNTDTKTDVSQNMGGPIKPLPGDPPIPAPTLRVNPAPIRPLETTGDPRQVGPCFNGLGDCPAILSSFK
jgi:peptidoglycan hydrolase-like protein with peptidoglycan-binding domain